MSNPYIAGLAGLRATLEENGGPAFPAERIEIVSRETDDTAEMVHYCGMSLRDWFAGQALSTLGPVLVQGRPEEDPDSVGTMAYRIADAMLAAREKEPTS